VLLVASTTAPPGNRARRAARRRGGGRQAGAEALTPRRWRPSRRARCAGSDLIIRTSGEQRLSNFLMWQAAYSELVFRRSIGPNRPPRARGPILNSTGASAASAAGGAHRIVTL